MRPPWTYPLSRSRKTDDQDDQNQCWLKGMVLRWLFAALVVLAACGDDGSDLARDLCERVDACQSFQQEDVDGCVETVDSFLDVSPPREADACEARLQVVRRNQDCEDLVAAFYSGETSSACVDYSLFLNGL